MLRTAKLLYVQFRDKIAKLWSVRLKPRQQTPTPHFLMGVLSSTLHKTKLIVKQRQKKLYSTLLKDCRGMYGAAKRSKFAINTTDACFRSIIAVSSSGHCKNFINECVQVVSSSFSRGLSVVISEIRFKNGHKGAPCNVDLQLNNNKTVVRV